jgi:hypothetical protein
MDPSKIGRRQVAAIAIIIACCSAGSGPGVAGAATCENERIRHEEAYAARLPDCRAYEQVSPQNKNNTDAVGQDAQVQSSPLGSSISYLSYAPFPGIEGAAEYPTYLSSAESERWSTQGIFPPSEAGSSALLPGWTEDLRYTVVGIGDLGPLIGEASIRGEEGTVESAVLGEWNFYLRDNTDGSYRLLAPGNGVHEVRFDDSSRGDSSILFEDRAKLTKKAAFFSEEVVENGTNLYEWKDGVVTLVGVLPNGEAPAGGSVAGPGGPAIREHEAGAGADELPGGATSGGAGRFYTQNTISEDGSRVFFTDVGTGHIYMREPNAKRTIPVSAGEAYWRAATTAGSYIFYTEGSGAKRNLYRFAVEVKKREPLTMGEAHVLGTLGISNDGSYAYFIAENVLPGTVGASAGNANLYEWHSGETIFISTLSLSTDYNDWTDFTRVGGAEEGGKTSRVTQEGTTILFSSYNRITSYDNGGKDELYLYDATRPLSARNPACVSCNPRSALATGEVYLTHHFGYTEPFPHSNFLTNNLSEDGNRVFFQTAERLVSGDINDQMDVYEWEREGSGSCAVGSGVEGGGCLYLISTGESPTEAYFGDASANGSNVFFFTRQSLVAQDQDDNVDVYDARENGGLASQNAAPTSPCGGEVCRGSASPTPAFSASSSMTLSGIGNLVPPAESKLAAKSKGKPPTRLQKLASALRACGKKAKTKKQRVQCEIQVQRRYGAKAKRSNRRGK